jgi:ATP/ADP translocase
LVGASAAYEIADKNGFTPTDTSKRNGKSKSSAAAAGKSDIHKAGILKKATHLFARVPVLWALFLEILASQGLATVLNVCFVARLATAIPDDSDRAGWVGIFFALINVITMVLQFGILPPLMTIIEPKDLWRAIPVVSLLFTGFQALQKNPSLYTVSASLAIMKISEYSARRMLDEMIYVPLDFESRFLGKEVIGVFGYRFGKSLMSLALSGVTSVTGNFGLQELSILSNGVALLWMRTAWRLSNFVPTRQEAEDEYELSRNIKKTKK